jgi:hypothetical protein
VFVDLEVLKKKISAYKGEGGRIRMTSDELLIEILWDGGKLIRSQQVEQLVDFLKKVA